MNEESKLNRESISQPVPDAQEAPAFSPELIRRVASMLADNGTDARATPENSEQAAGNGDLLTSLLADPTLLQRLPQIIALMKPLLASPTVTTDAAKPTSSQPKGTADNQRDRLLLSLKPFLSPSRCQAIDTMLRLAQLGELFGQFK